MSNIKPAPGYLLIKPKKVQKTTSSGIVLPDSHDEKPQQGVVLAIGAPIFNNGKEVKAPCKVKEMVIYREWGGKEYKDGQEDLLLLKFDDIMATIK